MGSELERERGDTEAGEEGRGRGATEAGEEGRERDWGSGVTAPDRERQEWSNGHFPDPFLVLGCCVEENPIGHPVVVFGLCGRGKRASMEPTWAAYGHFSKNSF